MPVREAVAPSALSPPPPPHATSAIALNKHMAFARRARFSSAFILIPVSVLLFNATVM